MEGSRAAGGFSKEKAVINAKLGCLVEKGAIARGTLVLTAGRSPVALCVEKCG